MSRRVVVIDPGYGGYSIEQEALVPEGYEVEVAEGAKTPEEKADFARGAVGIFVRGTLVDGEFLDRLPGLEVIVRYGVGYDNVDVGAATERGIKVANVQGYANHSVSDHALALAYACLRGLGRGHRMAQGHYGSLPYTPILAAKDAVLGILGLGNIGGTLCQKARHLFRQVIACDPYKPDDWFAQCGATRVTFDDLLEKSDIITLHCDLNEETAGIIDAVAFERMDKKPFLINTARGGIIDEMALLPALKKGLIKGAGLDVFVKEPPGDEYKELLNHPNVMATGHYAWHTEEASLALQEGAARNMAALLRGENIKDCLNPS